MSIENYLNKIILGDCLEVMKNFPKNSVDLIFTDPPYKQDFDYIWKPLGLECFRLLKDGGSLLTLCGHYQLQKVLTDLAYSGLTYYWTCAIWNGQEPYFFKNQLKVTWKPLLWFTKGAIPKHKTLEDGVKPGQGDKSYHPWGQSESFALQYIEALTSKDAIILDPFCGGGTVPTCALKLGRKFIGIDNKLECVDISKKRLKDWKNYIPKKPLDEW